MKLKIFAIIWFFVCIAFILVKLPHTPTPVIAVVTPTPVSDRRLVIQEINVERRNNGLVELTENEILDKTAKIKACDLRDRNYWSHQDPEGRFSWHLFIENGYNYKYAGENLAREYGDNVVVEAWMNSPVHKEIILKPEYREIGIGECGVFTAAHFGVK